MSDLRGAGVLTVVTGPPCAGKSTYVRAASAPGDIVVDLDVIASALSGVDPDAHDHPRHVRVVAIAATSAAIARALRFARTSVRIWVIQCTPSASDREAYRRAGATFKLIDPGLGVCLERASDRPPHMRGLILDWYGVDE
jgi:hypothetical protein